MKFQLLNLIIWPKKNEFPPRQVIFKPGMLNVITGASRTGKSAIIPIIDYCLASTDCNIPIDTIRDNASWYGIIIQTDNEEILICRKVPDGSRASVDFFLQRGKKVSIPDKIEDGNEKIDGIKLILNTISSVPYIGLSEEEKGYKARLSFRDLMALVFQSQDIVANQNILFYKSHAHEHREKLRNWFPFILGAETIDVLSARQQLQIVEIKLNQLRKEHLKAKAVSASWMANMIGHLSIAKEYGLLENAISLDALETTNLLDLAKGVLDNIPDHSQTQTKDIEGANADFEKFEREEALLSGQIALAKKRLSDLNSLKAGMLDYGSSAKKRVERLHISRWLQDVSNTSLSCPACGSAEHPNSNTELNKIASVLAVYEDESKNMAEVPTSLSREEDKIKKTLADLLEDKKALQERFDLLLTKDKNAQEEFQRRKNMFLFLGHLKASYETFEKLADGGDFQLEISLLEEEYNRLQQIVDIDGVKRRLEIALTRISGKISHHLKTLDVEDKYRKIPPKFDVENLSISVLSNDEHWHFLAQVGSASNWVSFHIALMCALQEYFIGMKKSPVPSFVIFDQPSQVYFPKLKRGEILEGENDVVFNDEDVDAVKSIFQTIANSILSESGNWQAVILDHADDAVYKDMPGVHEVEVWRNGQKLIPKEWIE